MNHRQLCRSQARQGPRNGLRAIPAGPSTSRPPPVCWLNAVEGFFAKLTRRRLKHGVFRSVTELQAAINRFIAEHNEQPKPFVWRADPNAIIAATLTKGSKRWSQSARISTFPRHPFPMLPPRRWRARSRSGAMRRRALAGVFATAAQTIIVVTSRSSFHRIDRPLCCRNEGGPSSCADRHSLRRAVASCRWRTFRRSLARQGRGHRVFATNEIAIGPELRAHAVRKPGTV